MTDFVGDLERRYPSQAGVDEVVREAHALRAKAFRDGTVSILELMQFAFRRKPAPAFQH